MLQNAIKARLADGEAVFGCFVRTAEPSLIEYVALLGWDFLVFDAEHGTLSPHQVEDLCRAIEPRGATPLVRVTTNDLRRSCATWTRAPTACTSRGSTARPRRNGRSSP